MKRSSLSATLLLTICALTDAPLGAQVVVGSNVQTLGDTLVGIFLDFSAGWEPQSGNEEDAIARGRKYFVTDSTFAMVIDTIYRPSYDLWWARTAVSIPAAFREYSEQHHHIKAARVLVLADSAAALTVTYCVDFTKRDGTRGTSNSATTMVFVRRSGAWKIAQYHGSHGPEVVTDDNCAVQARAPSGEEL